jgi:hypothetical protein
MPPRRRSERFRLKALVKGAKFIYLSSFNLHTEAEQAVELEKSLSIRDNLDSLPPTFIPDGLESPIEPSAGPSCTRAFTAGHTHPIDPSKPMLPCNKLSRNAASHKHSKKRAKKQQRVRSEGYKPSELTIKNILDNADYKHLEDIFADEDFEWVQTGYSGIPNAPRNDGIDEDNLTVEKLVTMGFRLVEWDGRYVPYFGWPLVIVHVHFSRPIVLFDRSNKVIAVLIGYPIGDDGSYNEALRRILDCFVEIGLTVKFESCQLHHRRGDYAVLNFGISHGNGYQAPFCFSNEKHKLLERELLDPEGGLSKHIGRVAGF